MIVNNHQRVIVYANALFNVAAQMSTTIGLSKGIVKQPAHKQIGVTIEEYFLSGGLRISMFALAERVCRLMPLSPLSHMIISKLLPADLENIEDPDERRLGYLRIARMRVAHKLAQFGDANVFWEKLLMSKEASCTETAFNLDLLLQTMAERHQIYFTAMERHAIMLALFPELGGNFGGGGLIVHLRSPDASERTQT